MSKKRSDDAGSERALEADGHPDEGSEQAPASEAESEGETAAPGCGHEPEIAALRDQLLRMAADFDNYRKRTRKESEELRKYGIEKLLHDVLPVLDNLDRALAHSEGDKSPVVQGIRMVFKQFGDVLSRYGVSSFASVGQPFDPERHEAVGQAPAGDRAPGTIVEEASKGYVLHDRLLRPARVVVAAAPAQADDTAESGKEAH